MAYNGRHPNIYDTLSEAEKLELDRMNAVLHRQELEEAKQAKLTTKNNSNNDNATLEDDSSDEEDDAGERQAMLKDAGLLFKRPLILHGDLKNEFQGRQMVNRLFDLMDENRKIDVEEANRPPPTYYWTPGHEQKYQDLGAWGKIKHNLHWLGYKAFWGVAFVGEVQTHIGRVSVVLVLRHPH